jgi:hypothetical protein
MHRLIQTFRNIWLKILNVIPKLLLKDNIVLLGIFCITLLFLRKLFRNVIIKPLFPESLSWSVILLFGFLLICSLFRIGVLIWSTWFKNERVEVSTITESVILYYQKIHENFGDYSDNLITKYMGRFFRICLHYVARILHENRFKLNDFIFLTIILPKLIICFAFSLDVFYFAQFYYFYASLYLIFVPLITRILHYHLDLLYLFKDETYKDILVMEPLPLDSEYYDHHPFYPHHNFIYSWTPSMAEKYSHDELNYYVYNIYWPIAYLDATLQTWSYLKSKLLLPTLLFTYSIYSLGWGYLFWTTLLIKLAEV